MADLTKQPPDHTCGRVHVSSSPSPALRDGGSAARTERTALSAGAPGRAIRKAAIMCSCATASVHNMHICTLTRILRVETHMWNVLIPYVHVWTLTCSLIECVQTWKVIALYLHMHLYMLFPHMCVSRHRKPCCAPDIRPHPQPTHDRFRHANTWFNSQEMYLLFSPFGPRF